MSDRRFVVGVTGASGAAYVGRLLEMLGASGAEIHLMVSKWGWRLIHDELGLGKGQLDELSGGYGGSIVLHNDNDVGAAPGSGSFVHDGMVILPCSANTLGRIASGMTENLVQRAAACCLKERRRLVLCHRETPLSLIEIENMAAVTRAGGIVAPLNPGFYLNPNSMEEMIDFMIGRILDLLGVEHDLRVRWEEQLQERRAPSSDAD